MQSKIEMTLDEQTEFSTGFDAGNYGSAYESQDWRAWSAKRNLNARSNAYRQGAVLGFYSTYETHEVPDSMRNTVEVLRAKFGEE